MPRPVKLIIVNAQGARAWDGIREQLHDISRRLTAGLAALADSVGPTDPVPQAVDGSIEAQLRRTIGCLTQDIEFYYDYSTTEEHRTRGQSETFYHHLELVFLILAQIHLRLEAVLRNQQHAAQPVRHQILASFTHHYLDLPQTLSLLNDSIQSIGYVEWPATSICQEYREREAMYGLERLAVSDHSAETTCESSGGCRSLSSQISKIRIL